MKNQARKALLVAVILTVAGNGSATAETQSELRAKLEQMGAKDQAARSKLTPFLASGDFGSAEFKAVADEIAAVDSRNLSELEKIIEQHGWPDRRVVGADANNSAFLILQHSP